MMHSTATVGLLALLVVCFSGSVLSCPEECQCSAQVADCNGRNLKYIPYNFPSTLTVLRLDGNSIRNVPNDAFQGLDNLQILSLARNSIDDIPPGTFLHTPHLMSLDISQNKILYLDKDTFKGLSDLMTLSIAYNSLQAFNGMLQHTPNLGSLNLGYNSLKQLTNEDLRLTSKIKQLDLSNNQISEVHGDAFKNISGLRYLFIQNNPLGPELMGLNFTNSLLQVADFTNCSLTKVPHVLPSTLSDLRLSKNKITIVDESDIRNITRLQLLALDNNRITNVLYRTFRGLEHLKELWLSHNKMVYIPRGLPSSLTKLYMDNNLIQEMEETMFKNDSQLEHLSMEMNRIEMIPAGAFNNMLNLKVLDLKVNRVKELKPGTFSDLPNLNYLDLSNNMLETIPAGTFIDLQNVTKLGLSHVISTMTDIGDNFLEAMPNLETIELVNSPGLAKGIMKMLQGKPLNPLTKASKVNLMYCDLSTLPPEIRELVPNVQELLLDDNPWMCDTRLRWLKNWMLSADVTFSKDKPVTCESPVDLKGQKVWQVADRDFIEPVKEEEVQDSPGNLNALNSGTRDIEDRETSTEATTTTTEATTTTSTTTTTTTTTTPEPTTTEAQTTTELEHKTTARQGRRPYNPFYRRHKGKRRRYRLTTVAPGTKGAAQGTVKRPVVRRRKYQRRRHNRRRHRLRLRKTNKKTATYKSLNIRHPRKKAEQIARWRKQAEKDGT